MAAHNNESIPVPVSEEQYRWIVTGCALHVTLTPALQPVIQAQLEQLYTDNEPDLLSKSSKKPSVQKCLLQNRTLNFLNINGNLPKTPHKNSVKSAVDLAKLFLANNMAKFATFGDMDASAVLNLLGGVQIPAFFNVNTAADDVRKEVRNVWGHGVDTANSSVITWNEAKFRACFHLMRRLADVIGLSQQEKDELSEWESKGIGRISARLDNLDAIHGELGQLTRHVTSFEESVVSCVRQLEASIDTLLSETRKTRKAVQGGFQAMEENHDEMKSLVNKGFSEVLQTIGDNKKSDEACETDKQIAIQRAIGGSTFNLDAVKMRMKSLDHLCANIKPDDVFMTKLRDKGALSKFEYDEVSLEKNPYSRNRCIIDKLRSKQHYLEYLNALVETNQYDIVLFLIGDPYHQ